MAIGGFQTRKKKRVITPGPKACHPKLGLSRSNACLPPEVLEELGVPRGLKGVYLRKWMTRKMNCKSERCLLEKVNLDNKRKSDILKSYFRPTMPDSWIQDPDNWLDSNNISDVMKQYEEAYSNFKFFGTNPIDFAAPDPYNKDNAMKNMCLQDEICKLNLKDMLSKGKTKLGFIYNLDPSNKGGSHWIASFTDIPAHRTYYFDSYGMKVPPQIAKFMRALTLQDPKMRLEYNARRFQYGDSECGIYSIYFLIRMIEGDNFKKFCRRAPTDNDMLELRQWLFSTKT